MDGYLPFLQVLRFSFEKIALLRSCAQRADLSAYLHKMLIKFMFLPLEGSLARINAHSGTWMESNAIEYDIYHTEL